LHLEIGGGITFQHPTPEHNKKLAEEVSDKRAIDAFTQGLRRVDFVEEMGRIKPKTVAELMDVANRFADGEDAYQNKRTRSPKDDRSNRYNNHQRRSHNYDNYGSHNQVAAGYKEKNYQNNDVETSGIAMTTEMTVTGSIGQEVQENTINH
jgi:hypothetical protein